MTLVLLVPAVLLLPEKYGILATTLVAVEILARRISSLDLRLDRIEVAAVLMLLLSGLSIFQMQWQSIVGAVFYCLTAISSLIVLSGWRAFRVSHYRAAIRILVGLAVVEAVLILRLWVQLDYPNPDDWAHVLISNAHLSGILLTFCACYALANVITRPSLSWLLTLVVLCPAIYLTATKQAYIAFLAGLLVLALTRLRRSVALVIALCGAVYLSVPVVEFLTYQWEIGARIPKIVGYEKTIQMLSDNPTALIAGVGVGNYGSRAAVARSSPVDLAKPHGQKVPRFLVETPTPMKIYLANEYSPAYRAGLALTGTYYTPFSTWNSIIGETGILGVVVMLYMFTGLIGTGLDVLRRDSFNVGFVTCASSVALVVLFLYDNWLEYPSVLIPFSVFAGYACRLNSRMATAHGAG